jgi:hypothetical protein
MLPLKTGVTYRTNRGDLITLIEGGPLGNENRLYSEEVKLWFDPKKLRAPCTSCEIVEKLTTLSEECSDIRPSSLSHEEMMQRLKELGA